MTDTAASLSDATLFDGRVFALGDVRGAARSVLGSAAMGVAAVAAVGTTIGVATVTAAWLVGVAFSGNPHLQAPTAAGPARLALADTAAFPPTSFEAKWAPTTAAMSVQARLLAARATQTTVADAGRAVSPPATVRPKVKHEVAHASALAHVAKLTPPVAPVPVHPHVIPQVPKPALARIANVPLPRPKPLQREIAQVPAEKPAPQVALVTPPPAPPVEKRIAPEQARPKAPVLPGPQSRTALYDIAGHTVYLPNGKRLEAHSGLGSKLDDPRYIKVRMRGPTPPNVYDLTLREQLFHGVRAIRLTPVDSGKMFGRDGMLAHTYMLGPNGQSNGCVSFKNYQAFLRAFTNGEVDRMVVVAHLRDAPPQLASLVRAPRGHGYRYAANNASASTW